MQKWGSKENKTDNSLKNFRKSLKLSILSPFWESPYHVIN